MRRVGITVTSVLIVCALACSGQTFGAKGEDAKKPVRLRDQPRLEKLANQESRVYGSCSDIDEALRKAPSSMPILSIAPAGRFYYAGDAKALSAFLADCAALDTKEPVSIRDKVVTLVLHPGQAPLKEGRPYDWEAHWEVRMQEPKVSGINEWRHFYVVTKIDVWLGGKVRLDQLKVPPTIIEVRSGGEIEEFIEQHNKSRQRSQKAK